MNIPPQGPMLSSTPLQYISSVVTVTLLTSSFYRQDFCEAPFAVQIQEITFLNNNEQWLQDPYKENHCT